MLSILIPNHNYYVYPLVKAISHQLAQTKINFEILVYDDNSKQQRKKNYTVNQLEHCVFKQLKTNIGRTSVRQLLALNAKFNNLLFLDADVMPKNNTFITRYLNFLDTNFNAIFGGYAYNTSQIKQDSLLRWKYGKLCEEKAATLRNKKPYKVIISGNMLIKKELFILLNSKMLSNVYGLDNYFGALLKENNIAPIHIDNEVYHLGIEQSITYLEKKEQAAKTLLDLYKANKINTHNNDLLSLFQFLKRYKLNYFTSLLYIVTKKILRRNLLGKYPSIKLLQFYRISYMCNSYVKSLKK